MKLTKQQEKEVKNVVHSYWANYIKGDIEGVASLLDPHYKQIGSADTEVFFNKKDAVKFLYDTIEQVTGKLEMRNHISKIDPLEDFILVSDLCDLYVLNEKEWMFYSKFRASTLLQKKNGFWKIVHQHSSVPDAKTSEGENIAIEAIAAENLQLKEAVRRRTIELESKNRELEIEASLERVRARTMAMQKSDELAETSFVLFKQFKELGFDADQISVGIMNELEKVMEVSATIDGNKFVSEVKISFDEPYLMKKVITGWNEQEKSIIIELSGDELKAYNNYRNNISHVKFETNQGDHWIVHIAFFSRGILSFSSHKKHSDETIHLLERFASVFDQTYIRFLDLQKAEEQARESQIQLALERVRAKTMAMQHSNELQDTAILLFEQMKVLGIDTGSCGFNIWDKKEKATTVWMSSSTGGLQPPFKMPHGESPIYKQVFDEMKKGELFFVKKVGGKTLEKHFDYLLTLPVIGDVIKQLRETSFVFPKSMVYHFAFFNNGYLSFHLHEPHPETHEIFKRFAKVFEQTYTRFLDLQQAETQAWESLIEASLERVRSRAMAMHKSSDLPEAAATVFSELKKLGIHALRCGFVLLNKESKRAKLYPATSLDNQTTITYTGEFEFIDHPIFEKQYETWENQENYHPVLEGELLKSYYTILSEALKIPYEELPTTKKQYGSFLPFTEGFLFTWSIVPYTDESLNILNRFKSILDLTTRRYLDLQKAEAQTREAQIEAGLERVRSRTLAMHSSDELAETAAVVFKQLMLLGIAPNRLYIGIMKDNESIAEFWITDEDGSKVSSAFATDLTINPSFKKMLSGWKEQKKSITIDMVGKELEEYLEHLMTLSVPFKGGLSQKHRVQTIAFFSKGFIGIASPDSQPMETTLLLERFATVFNLTFTRFNDLQIAEEQARKAIIEEQKLREEKKRADLLLLNILPEQIANELKEFGKSYARKHENVTILFADIKGFSTIAETLSAEELVTQLDECFRAFDKIVDKHGLEKIKTVGDAYVCACGLPNPVQDHAAKTVAAALDMNEFIKGFAMTKRIQDLPAFDFRIGIHTGPVVTGVVGLKKFTYDLWGDAVNLAARMEQHGEAGKINISGKTFELVKDKYNCLHRGKIEAKNKGEIDMYFVEGVL